MDNISGMEGIAAQVLAVDFGFNIATIIKHGAY
jgi:hypothetical protein